MNNFEQSTSGLYLPSTGPVTAEELKEIMQPSTFTDREALHGFITKNTEPYATILSDDAKAYEQLPQRMHKAVKHGSGEYVRGIIHTNGIESVWATLKRGVNGVYHRISPKHLHRYTTEFAGRHNQRPMDTREQMESMARGMMGKRLTYRDLVGSPSDGAQHPGR